MGSKTDVLVATPKVPKEKKEKKRLELGIFKTSKPVKDVDKNSKSGGTVANKKLEKPARPAPPKRPETCVKQNDNSEASKHEEIPQKMSTIREFIVPLRKTQSREQCVSTVREPSPTKKPISPKTDKVKNIDLHSEATDVEDKSEDHM